MQVGLAATALALTMGLTACGDGRSGGTSSLPAPLLPPPPVVNPPPAPVPPAPPQLRPGELYVSAAGVAVGAPVGSLDAAVGLVLEATALPAVPLPDGLEALGSAWLIGAEATTEARADNQFTLGFVRAGTTEPDDFQILRLSRAAEQLHGRLDGWVSLRTSWFESSSLLYTGVPALRAAGDIYLLVRRAAAASAALPAEHSRKLASASLTWTTTPSPLVETYCSGFTPPTTVCDPAARHVVEQAFEEMLGELLPLGYGLPELVRRQVVTATAPHTVEYGPFQVELRPCPANAQLVGEYDHRVTAIFLCISTPMQDSATLRAGMRHELFHALQFRSGSIYLDWREGARSFVEGSAAAMEVSTSSLRRTPSFKWLAVDEPMLQDDHRYRTQDFWVFLAQRLGRGAEVFLPFIRDGARPAALDATMRTEFSDPDLNGLGSAYFAWAKNQAYEATTRIGAGTAGETLEGGECRYQYYTSAGARSYTAFKDFKPDDAVLLYDPDQPSQQDPIIQFLDGKLTAPFPLYHPLQTVVLPLRLEAPRDYSVRVYVESENDDPALRYKVYDVDDASGNCRTDPDDTPRHFDVRQGSPREVAVMFAFADFEDRPPVGLAAKIVVELVSVRVAPESGSVTLQAGETVTQSFAILNSSSGPVTYSATGGESWLRVTGGATGLVPANGSVTVSYEVTCAPESPAQGSIALTFAGADGTLLAPPDAPAEFPVEQICNRPPDSRCYAPYELRGHEASATLTWNGSGGSTTQSGTTTVYREVDIRQSIELTQRLEFDPMIHGSATNDFSGFGSVEATSTTTTITGSNTSTSETRWSGTSAAYSQLFGDVPATIGFYYNNVDCTWGLRSGSPLIEVERTVTSSSGSSATTTLRIPVGDFRADHIGLSGTLSIPLSCPFSRTGGVSPPPGCDDIGVQVALRTTYEAQTGVKIDDSSVPPATLTWSISPIVGPVP
jgi:hypothetical protein